jgi:hypothetical protein
MIGPAADVVHDDAEVNRETPRPVACCLPRSRRGRLRVRKRLFRVLGEGAGEGDRRVAPTRHGPPGAHRRRNPNLIGSRTVPMPPRHLLTVWNPSYSDDPMDQHLELLLAWAEKYRKGEADRERVYVWWAKIRSPNREGNLPHHDDVAQLQRQIDDDIATHLYLTDYRSLYVAQLDEVTADDVLRETPDEAGHAPSYYARNRIDFWFRLTDIRRLVGDDTPAVIALLKGLRNTRYHDRPVSIYGGITELPLIVTEAGDERWFDGADTLMEGRLWVERDATLRHETDRLARELRDDLIGRDVWAALELTTRTFVASAEAVFRTRRDDPGFDFSAPAVEYAKAVETELNAIVFGATRRMLGRAGGADRHVNIDGRAVDLAGRVPHQPLGTLRNLLQHEAVVRRALGAAYPHDATWLLGQLPHELAPLLEVRNPAAHDEVMGAERIARERERVLGIGCEGLLVRLARVRLRAS